MCFIRAAPPAAPRSTACEDRPNLIVGKLIAVARHRIVTIKLAIGNPIINLLVGLLPQRTAAVERRGGNGTYIPFSLLPVAARTSWHV